MLNAYPVLLESGKKLVVADDNARDIKPRFFMMANAALELMPQLDANATWLFWKLMNERNLNTNMAELTKAQLTTADYGRLRRGYFTLKRHNVVRRVKQSTYQLNPDYVLPIQGYQALRKEWEMVIGQ